MTLVWNGAVAVADMRVEREAGFGAVAQIDAAALFAATADGEALAVRRCGGSRSPMGGERQLMLIIHELGECFTVGLVTHMPGAQRIEPVERAAGTRLGHFRQTQVDRIGEQYRQQRCAILHELIGAQMTKVAREVAPVIDFKQEVR